jgi:hypothetical protein
MNDITLTRAEAEQVLEALGHGRNWIAPNGTPSRLHRDIIAAINMMKAKMPPDGIDLGNGFTVKNGHNLHYVFTAGDGKTWTIGLEKKIEAIKMIRFLSGVGLQEGKEITDRVEGKA